VWALLLELVSASGAMSGPQHVGGVDGRQPRLRQSLSFAQGNESVGKLIRSRPAARLALCRSFQAVGELRLQAQKSGASGARFDQSDRLDPATVLTAVDSLGSVKPGDEPGRP